MFEGLKKLRYATRVLLSRGAGQSEAVDVAGRSIVLRHAGEGVPFVYLHSTLGESSLWLPFFQTWAKSFHVLVPTHPGFGKSGGFEAIDGIEDMAFHYAELLDALGLEQVVLGGVSLGGWIAAEFAVRWPERVTKLWLSGAPGLWVDGAPLGDLFRVMHNRQELRQLLFHDPTSAMASLVLKDEPDEATMLAAYQSLTVLARLVWQRPYDPKLAARLYRIRCPTLLLWGEDDRLVPPAYGQEYARHIPGADFRLLPRCGHLPMFECEQAFVDAVTRFCQG